MSIYSHYNYTNALGAAALFPNMCSPATQMIFSGTNSSMNLANWNVFGGYNSYCGGCNNYSNGQILGYSAAIGLGFVGNILLQNWIGRAGAKASEPTNQQQADGYEKQMNKLASSIGADNWEDAIENSYESPKLKELNQSQKDAANAIKDAESEVNNTNTGLNAQNSKLDAKEGEIAVKKSEIDKLDKNSPNYNTDLQKLTSEMSKLKREKTEIEQEVKRLEDLKQSTEKGGKLYETNEKAKAAVEAEQKHIKEVQDKIKHIRD